MVDLGNERTTGVGARMGKREARARSCLRVYGHWVSNMCPHLHPVFKSTYVTRVSFTHPCSWEHSQRLLDTIEEDVVILK